MKEYEVIHEIFNECANNQMRDVFFEEVMIEDLEAYIRGKHKDSDLKMEREELADGTIISMWSRQASHSAIHLPKYRGIIWKR